MGAIELLALQHLDDRVAQLEGETATIASRLQGSPELERARTALATAERARAQADAAVRACERDAAVIRDRVRQLDRKLYDGSIGNPTELLSLQRELDDARVRLRAHDEEELALMEVAESAAAAVDHAREALTAIESARAASAGPDADELARLRTSLAAAIAERDLEISRRGAAELALYRRVAARHRPAVVRLAGAACGGCRLPLGQSEVHAVRIGDGIVQCSHCDRVLAP